MRRAGAGDPTLLQVLAVLQAIFAYAVSMERVTDNPVSRVAKPRQPGGREVPPVPPVTVEQLRARLGPADALMVSVLAYAGLRPQELLALQWNDIHERAILVRRKNVDGELYPYTKTRRTGASSYWHRSASTWRSGSWRPAVAATISSFRMRVVSRGRDTSTSTGAGTCTSRTPPRSD